MADLDFLEGGSGSGGFLTRNALHLMVVSCSKFDKPRASAPARTEASRLGYCKTNACCIMPEKPADWTSEIINSEHFVQIINCFAASAYAYNASAIV